MGKDLSQLSLMDLFRAEAETQTQVLTSGLLALERDPKGASQLEACMRAAHSMKGAARIIDLGAGVSLSHAMEEVLVAAQTGRITLDQSLIDLLLDGVDLIVALTREPDLELGASAGASRPEIDAFVAKLNASLAGGVPTRALGQSAVREFVADESVVLPDMPAPPNVPAALTDTEQADPAPLEAAPAAKPAKTEAGDRALRVTVDSLNRLLGLAGELLVESRRFKPFAAELRHLKRLQQTSAVGVEHMREAAADNPGDGRLAGLLADARSGLAESQRFLVSSLETLDVAERRSSELAKRLYDQALACRMRPLADITAGLPRMVRDVSRSLDKRVRLEIIGEMTRIDRDVLEKIEAPLGHLLRNAVDHGIEAPDQRRAAGKPAEGAVRIQAYHSAGRLQVVVSDDGRGIDLDKVRAAIVRRQLAREEIVKKLSESELLEFLFLPGFSMSEHVTEISGRGVGLDVVQNMVKQVRGTVRISTRPSEGTRFHLQLPLTLSVVRTLLVEVGGEPYAVPLAHIFRVIRLAREKIVTFEGMQHFDLDGQRISLGSALQILEGTPRGEAGAELCVLVIGDDNNRFGIVVDRFLDRRELVVHPLDPRLGKIKDISAAAVLEDGSPILIVDVEDLIRSMQKLAHAERLGKVGGATADAEGKTKRRRVLVVDDSLIVRELERKLLEQRGYEVELAVDGMDGWNVLKGGGVDLVITDIDMPRVDGIELVDMIRKDASTEALPVMILSYKDRDEDRRRGLAAGADYYLTKGSFQDDVLVNAVLDLIGEAMT